MSRGISKSGLPSASWRAVRSAARAVGTALNQSKCPNCGRTEACHGGGWWTWDECETMAEQSREAYEHRPRGSRRTRRHKDSDLVRYGQQKWKPKGDKE